MQNQGKHHFIYLRSTRERIPVSEEEFRNYYRDIDNFRRNQQRHGRCVCPAAKRLDCDMDCYTCPFHRAGDALSLDYTNADAEGNEQALVDTIADDAPLIEDILAESDLMERLLARITELMPQALDIGKLRLQGLSEDAIAAQIGTGRKTYAYRLKKVEAVLKDEFPEFF